MTTTTIKENSPVALAGTFGELAEKTEETLISPLALNNTTALRNVNNYLNELQRLSDQASRMGLSLLALELAILRAERFAAQLRQLSAQGAE